MVLEVQTTQALQVACSGINISLAWHPKYWRADDGRANPLGRVGIIAAQQRKIAGQEIRVVLKRIALSLDTNTQIGLR